MSNKNAEHYFLKGGGEMGELIRAKDWSKTSLGDPSTWPQSLCTMVAVMLDNPFGMYIAWGNDYTQLYNDGYRPILGTNKHPQALGISTRETFAEIWNIIGPMFADVMKGNAVGFPDFMLPLNRNGYVEECYFDFSYSPIRKDDGEVGGILVTVIETTHKKKNEENLRESNRRFRDTMKQAPVGITILRGPEYIVEMANSAYLQLVDRKEDEFVGSALFKSLPEVKSSVHSLLDKVLITGEPYHGNEVPVPLNRQGKQGIFYFDFLYHPLKEDDGRISGVIVTVTEVTEKVEARKKIEASEERLNIVVEASELGTWELNLKTKEPSYSKRYLEILGGYTEDMQFTHSELLEHLHPDDMPVREKAFKEAFETGYLHYESRLIWKDKSIHWMEGKGKVFYDEENKPIKLIGTIRDITEEKTHEEKLKKSEEQFSTLADNMENLAWLADSEGWIYWYNKRWLEYTGLTLEEMQGWGWQKVHHPDHVERVLEISKKIWHKNETFELTFPLRRHDGEYRWFLTRGYPVLNEEGNIIRWIGTNTDIDEQKKAEEQFKVLADQAPMWVWLTDKEVNVLYTNPEVLSYLGIAHYKDFTGRIWEQKVHPEDIEIVYKNFGEAASMQKSFSFEFRVLSAKSKKYEWFYIKAVPRLEAGEFTGFIGTGININEQKLIFSQLEYRKALLEAHNEASFDGILLVDTQGGILSYNQRFVEIWNMPKHIVEAKDDEKAIAFALTQLVNPEEFVDRVNWMYEHPNERSIDELEFKDGKILERHGYPVSAPDGSYFAWSWMFRDITEQKKWERTIRESEQKFRLLADSMPQHIWTSDPEGNLNYYNQSVFDFSGLTSEQLNKDGWIQIVHPDDREENIRLWKEAVSTGIDFLCEHRFRRHDGEYRWQLSRAIPQRDANGKIQMWVGTSTDIQEQKTFTRELEEKVLSRTAELKASEEKFYRLFNLSPICKILTDAQTGEIVMVNDAFTNLLGYSHEEVHHKTSAELGMLDPINREILANEIREHGKITNVELEYTKKSGEKFIALTSAELISLEDNKFFLGAFNDISDRKMAEKNLEQKNIELERMNKELQSFAYVSSHDLQEPLRKIQTFASRIQEKEKNNLSDYGKDLFNRMQRAANRMQTLIQDLLAYSRTNTNDSTFETTDLNKIVAEVREEFKDELKEKHAIIETNQLCEADIIPFQFRQLMHNLIGNSLKFSNPVHPPHIKIKSEIVSGIKFKNKEHSPHNKYCHITLSDNGIGFEQQYSERIFEVFQRLHGRSEYNGTGIGLSIVKKIVENHHGVITATGELNKGATFDIYIPVT